MLDWKTVSILPDWSVERLRSFWNWGSRHQGNPNDCARASAVIASKKTVMRQLARRRRPIRKPLINFYLQDYDTRHPGVYPKTIFYSGLSVGVAAEQDAVEQQLVGAVSLAAVLGSEAEQDDAALVDSRLDYRGAAGNHALAQHPAAHQQVGVGIARHHVN